jgi:hypothetical protein
LTPLHPEDLSTDWGGDPKQERRGITPLERDLKDNSRTGREIIDLLGVFFFYSFLMFCCCLNMNLCAILDMICG